MEKTIVQFILDNIFIFLPLGATGIIATVVLFFLPKKGPASKYDDVKSDVITFFKIRSERLCRSISVCLDNDFHHRIIVRLFDSNAHWWNHRSGSSCYIDALRI